MTKLASFTSLFEETRTEFAILKICLNFATSFKYNYRNDEKNRFFVREGSKRKINSVSSAKLKSPRSLVTARDSSLYVKKKKSYKRC